MIGSLLRLQFTALLSVGLGLVYTFGSPGRYLAVSYDGVKGVTTIRMWGILLLILGLVLLACLNRHVHPHLVALSAVLVCAWYAAWSGAFLATAIEDERASFGPALLFGYLAALHASLSYAAARTVRREQ